MRIVIDRRFLARAFGPAYGVLVIAAIGLSLLTPLPLVVGVTLAVAGATLASLLRVLLPRRLRFLGLFPALVALGVFVADSPVGTIPELAGGVGGLALLLWCAEDPDRYPGGLVRGLAGLAVPAAVVGIALAGSLLLPSGVGSLGIAAGLLAVTVVAVALLLGAPRAFDRDPSATS
ncbi:MAG: hypothetical protein WB789_04310 [Thermoplasmata archaeon]